MIGSFAGIENVKCVHFEKIEHILKYKYITKTCDTVTFTVRYKVQHDFF